MLGVVPLPCPNKKNVDGIVSATNEKSSAPMLIILITDNVLLQKLEIVLEEKAHYEADKTLLTTSLCCDEVNRELEDTLKSVYGNNFSMGGLAGFAFGGITSFGGTY